jgi:hypothetical protein
VDNRPGSANWSSILFSLVFVLTISAILASTLYNYSMAKWTPQAAYQLHLAQVDHTAGAPNRYRVLAPFLVEKISLLVHDSPERNFIIGYFAYYQWSVAFSLLMIFLYLRMWYTRSVSLTGLVIVAVSMLVSFGDGYFQPWSILEIGLFTAGLLAIYKDQKFVLIVLIILATLNRETGVFIAIAYPLIHLHRKAPHLSWIHLIWSGIFLAIWGIFFFGLHIWLGHAPQISIGQILQININPSSILTACLNVFLFLGAYWGLLKSGYFSANPYIKKTWRIVPLYIIVFLLFGIWQEVRLLAILYPILIPTGLSRWESL